MHVAAALDRPCWRCTARAARRSRRRCQRAQRCKARPALQPMLSAGVPAAAISTACASSIRNVCSIGRLRSQRSPRPHAHEPTASLSRTALASRRAPADSLPLSAAPVAGSTVQARQWDTPDGDFIELDWLDGPARRAAGRAVPWPGGSSRSHYARASCTRALSARGWRGVVAHFRGCGGRPNRLPRAYHSGDYRRDRLDSRTPVAAEHRARRASRSAFRSAATRC